MISSFDDLKPIEKHTYNLVKNDFGDFTEIVIYKKPFFAETGNFKGIDELTGELLLKNQNIDRTRKFENVDGVLKLKKGKKIMMSNLAYTIKNARKRALDNIYGYVLSNTWNYFVTLTFSPTFVNRTIDDEIKEFYGKFKRQLQIKFPNVKILAIPERHPRSGCLHFHCLFGDCDLSDYVSPAISPKTGKIIYSHGRKVYNLLLFKFGYSTLVKVDSDPLKVANYLTKYITKDFGNIGYNKKAFYRTYNLNFKNKQLYFYNDADSLQKNSISKLLCSADCEKFKETDKLIVYRYQKKKIEPTLVSSIPVFFDDSIQQSFDDLF